MRGMQKAVVLLAVMLGGIMTMNAAKAGAVEKGDLEIAIKKAELAVLMVKSPEFDAQKTYLKDRVAMGKKAVLNFDGYSNENLSELVATLEEGARALRLTAGVDRIEVDENDAAASAAMGTGADDVAKMASRAAESTTAIVQQNKAVKAATAQNARKAEVAKTVTTANTAEQKAVVANTNDTSEQAAKSGVAPGQMKDEAANEASEGSGQGAEDGQKEKNVEVPRTGGEEETGPSTVAVAITVGVVVGLSAFGAVAIVKRMKKNV